MSRETNVLSLKAKRSKHPTAPKLANLPRDQKKLLNMLQFKRPANSGTEAAFNRRYLRPVGARPDQFGNHWLTIPGNDALMFSSHTDTVHKEHGIQALLYGGGIVSAKDSNCLGADCTVGVWLMLEMIKKKIPGIYVFHAEEEIGGCGSNAIATETPDRLKNVKFAIAFDRKGYDEIITHQYSGRTASDEFAHSLASVLKPLDYGPSEHGSFTDTANYADLIPECTNISVGYFRQHESVEHLDIPHAAALRDALISADWSKLVCARDPTVQEAKAYKWVGKGLRGSWWKDAKKDEKIDTSPYVKWWQDPKYAYSDEPDRGETRLHEFVRSHPVAVATFLEQNGFRKEDIEDFMWGDLPAVS